VLFVKRGVQKMYRVFRVLLAGEYNTEKTSFQAPVVLVADAEVAADGEGLLFELGLELDFRLLLDLGRTLWLARNPLRTRRSGACRFARRARVLSLAMRAASARHAAAFQLAVGARVARHAETFHPAVGTGGAPRAVAFPLGVGAGSAPRAEAFQLAVGAGGALRAVAFLLPVRTGVTLLAPVFQLPVRAGGALYAVVFPLAVRAPFAVRAVAFPLAVGARVARRAALFHAAVGPRVTLLADIFPPSVRAPLMSSHYSPRAAHKRLRSARHAVRRRSRGFCLFRKVMLSKNSFPFGFSPFLQESSIL
jgi:hypothetical protein